MVENKKAASLHRPLFDIGNVAQCKKFQIEFIDNIFILRYIHCFFFLIIIKDQPFFYTYRLIFYKKNKVTDKTYMEINHLMEINSCNCAVFYLSRLLELIISYLK